MEDNIDDLLHDILKNVVERGGSNDGPKEEETKKFYNSINETKQELYFGCQSFSTLSFIIRLYLLKCLDGGAMSHFLTYNY